VSELEQPDPAPNRRPRGDSQAFVDREFVSLRTLTDRSITFFRSSRTFPVQDRTADSRCPLASLVDFLPGPPLLPTNEVLNQHGMSFSPLPQRRHLDGKNVEPIKQILAKRASSTALSNLDSFGDDREQRPGSLSPLHALEFPLPAGRAATPPVVDDIRHLVHEDRARRSPLEPTESPLHGPSETRLLMTEELRGNKSRGIVAQVTATNAR